MAPAVLIVPIKEALADRQLAKAMIKRSEKIIRSENVIGFLNPMMLPMIDIYIGEIRDD